MYFRIGLQEEFGLAVSVLNSQGGGEECRWKRIGYKRADHD